MEITQYITESLFFAFILLVIFGSVVAVRATIMMHSVLGLAVCLLGVAGLYYHLGSMFLTLMQVLIYVGAVCIVIIFGVMVGYTPREVKEKEIAGKNFLLAVSACVAAFIMLSVAIIRTVWTPAAEKTGDFTLKYLGETLLYRYCLAFELISVILLAAIIGSIILAQIGEEDA